MMYLLETDDKVSVCGDV